MGGLSSGLTPPNLATSPPVANPASDILTVQLNASNELVAAMQDMKKKKRKRASSSSSSSGDVTKEFDGVHKLRHDTQLEHRSFY